jgi:hypothetical protein
MPMFTVQFMGLCTFIQQTTGWRAVLVDASLPSVYKDIDARFAPLWPHFAQLEIAHDDLYSDPDMLLSPSTTDPNMLTLALAHHTVTFANPASPLGSIPPGLPSLATLAKQTTIGSSSIASNVSSAACFFDFDMGDFTEVQTCAWGAQIRVSATSYPTLTIQPPTGGPAQILLKDGATVTVMNSAKPGDPNEKDHFLLHYLTTDLAAYPDPTPDPGPGGECLETPACSCAKLS